jgi:membrane fusion protein (multidrug efflux system)
MQTEIHRASAAQKGLRRHHGVICILRSPWGLSTGVLAPLLLFASCFKQNVGTPGETTPVTVSVIRVEPRPLDVTLDITGSLVSSVAVDVKTEFSGRIIFMLKQEGDRVSKGELLAQLDDVNAKLAVAQTRANLAVAEATLDRAKVAEEHASTEFQRAQNLLRSGGITDRDYQAAQTSVHDSLAQVKLADAQVEQVRQALALAQKHLDDCRIISPISGEVESRFFNPGSWVDGNALLYRLVDNQRLELQTFVASSDMAAVEKGQQIRFSTAAYSGETFEATIRTLSAGVDEQNRSVPIRASVPNAGGKLKAGMFVKGAIITGTKDDALVVPANALWRRVGQAPFVFVVEENHARRREVQTGIEEPQGIEITQGLRPGEIVVAEQNIALADGVQVLPGS